VSEQIQAQRYSDWRRRILSLKGLDELSVDNHVQPVFVFDDFTSPEYRLDAGIKSWAKRVAIAGVAAQQPVFQINPALTSDSLIVVEGCAITSTLASDFDIGISTAEAVGTLTNLGNRQGADLGSSPTILQTGTLGAVTAPTQLRVTLPALGSIIIGPPFFPMTQRNIPSSNIFKVIGVTVNNTVTISACGYYRATAESEL
jgi:hypothetical protein